MAKKYKCRVEYLQSSGTQYIDTGVYPTQLTEVEYRCAVTGSVANVDSHLFGSRLSASSEAFDLAYMNTTPNGIEKFRFVHGTTTSQETTTSVTASQLANPHTYYMSGTSFKVDGSEKMSFTTASFTGTYSLWLFGVNNAGSLHNQVRAQKVYKCVIWNNGTLVRDLIPVLDLSGKPAMYDQVSGKLFYNQGTGEFAYGRQIIPVEYLESTGTQYIDTGIKGKNNLHYKTKVNFTTLSTGSSNGIGGEYLANASAYIGMVRANGHYTYLFNNTAVETTTTIYANADYEIDSVMNSGSQVLKVNGEIISTGTLSGTFISTRNIFLYAVCSTNDAADVYGSLKMYYCQIYDNDVLVRDFIPCIDENHVPFMFDRVSNTIYLNAGTGQFKVGPNVEKMWGGKKLRRKLAMILATLKKKRKFFCEVEYLESTGTQWINAGINVNTSTDEIKLYFELTETQNYKWFFGEYDTNARLGLGSGDGTDKRNFLYQQSATKVSDTQMYNKQHLFEINSSGGFLDGTKIRDYLSFASTSNIYLFNLNIDSPSDYRCKSKIWKYEHKRNGVLVRDMIPVLDWDMTPCMYDRVSGELFYNQGTGSFVVGRQIHQVEYLESTGTQYIDTGIQPTDEYGYKIKNTYTVGQGEQCAIGCMDNGNRFVGVYTSGSANQLSGAWGSFVGFLPTYSWTTGDILDVEVNYKNSRKMIVGGTELKDISDVHITGTISNTIYLGARNYGSNITKMRGNIYGVEITKGTEVIADYIPMVDEQGVGAMFNRVSHTIFDNAGTGAFNYPLVELEYLESTGTQYIDTGIKFDCANTKIEVKTYEDSLTRVHSICGDDGNCFYYFRGTGNWAVGYNYTAFNINSYVVVGDNTFVIDKNNVYLNGVLATTYTASSAVSSYNALLFNRKTSRPDSGAVTMYYCKIWNNGTLVRDFIPVFKDGQAGMLDKANNVFYSNAGTGSFSAGRIVEPEYE